MVEARIYEGFPSRADEERMRAFHAASWPERAELAETFDDDRLRELGRRLVFLNAPEVLSDGARTVLQAWLRNRLQGREGVEAGRTVAAALADLEAEEVDDTNAAAVQEIREWLEGFLEA